MPSNEEVIQEQQRNYQNYQNRMMNNSYGQNGSSIANRQQSVGNYKPGTTYTGISMDNYSNSHSHNDNGTAVYNRNNNNFYNNLAQPAGRINQKKLKGVSNIFSPKIIMDR